ncbi:MAG TPA: squalene/phytoene synthase family protein [Rhizomicrobium sp.]|nr:squalene/phytoene synthase family protein [Rhizomicrobium sp.]
MANRLAASVRAADPDRYFATLFAPPPKRPLLFALYAFNAEVARIAETVREPMLGAIRLEWWRESAEGAASGAVRNHDVVRGLAALFGESSVALAELEALIAARAFDSSAECFADFAALKGYVESTSGRLMRLAAQVLDGPPGIAETLRQAGLAYGLTGLLRALPFHNGRHKLYLPLDLLAALDLTPEGFFHLEQNEPRLASAVRQVALTARDHFLAARQAPKPGAALAAILPAALVPVYLRKLNAGRDVPIHRRQMALLSAAMKRRL